MTTTIDKWQMNRAGLFNYWYYDSQEFHFQGGKLLLKGANGSGKSVTMQSFLPLLLDGNKNPQRLDPFGSRSRKMIDYLLGENNEEKERTGYLFLEYKKKHSEEYVTTGLGLRTTASSDKVESWGFVIKNKRINHDFYLHNESFNEQGKKVAIPLSKQELIARVNKEKCGKVVNSQSEYAELVNAHIFKFKTIKEYEDMVKLIVQIRTPKLSNNLEPAKIYEILEQSLPELSHDDLHSLAETIGNIDKHKERLEKTKEESDYINAISEKYEDYNKAVLAKKAFDILDAHHKKANAEKESKTLGRQIEEASQHLLILANQEKQLDNEEMGLKEKVEKLKDSDEYKLVRDLEVKKGEQKERQSQLKHKQSTHESRKQREAKLRFDTKQTQSAISQNLEEIGVRQRGVDLLSQEIDFSSHGIYQSSFQTKMSIGEGVNAIDQWEVTAKSHLTETQAIYRLFEKESEKQRTVEESKAELDAIKKQKRELEQQKANTAQEIEEAIEHMLYEVGEWYEHSDELELTPQELTRVSEDIERLYEGTQPVDVSEQIETIYQSRKEQLVNEKAIEKSNLDQLNQEKNRLEFEHTKLLSKKELDPHNRKKETVEARAKLIEQGVDFLPFYEAVEFKDGVSEEQKGNIEAALLEMGILDSLIVGPTHRHRVFEADAVLIPEGQLSGSGHSLQQYLEAVEVPNVSISRQDIEAILASMMIDSKIGGSYVTPEGEYGQGILRGKGLKEQVSTLIGKESRKKYRLEQIVQIKESLIQNEEKMESVRQCIRQIENRIVRLTEEKEQFPTLNSLMVLHENEKRLLFQIEFVEKNQDSHNKKLDQHINQLREVQRERELLAKERKLSLKREVYENAIEATEEYIQILRAIRDTCQRYEGYKNKVESQQEQLEIAEQDVEEIYNEIVRAEKELEVITSSIQGMQEALESIGAKTVDDEIAAAQRRLLALPSEIKATITGQATQRELKKGLSLQLEKWERDIVFYRELYMARKHLFIAELQTGFVKRYDVYTLSNEQEVITVAKNIVEEDADELRNQVTTKEKSLSTSYSQVTLKGLMEYTPSWFEKETQVDVIEHDNIDAYRLEIEKLDNSLRRVYISMGLDGKAVSPIDLKSYINEEVEAISLIITKDNEQLFKDIIFNNVGERIRDLIMNAHQWKDGINSLMRDRVTSSAINLRLEWKARRTKDDEELSSKDLVSLLQRDPETLKDSDYRKLSNHFHAKIAYAKEVFNSDEKNKDKTIEDVIREVLDYRKWFEFKIHHKKGADKETELTKNAYLTLSGGERAMSMYIPLLAAIYSRYSEASPEAPYIISMDEAFAGVDDNNIGDMFDLIERLDFNYIINSQALWGDYETVSSLGISEILRPNNAKMVTVVDYVWNGVERLARLTNQTLDEVTI